VIRSRYGLTGASSLRLRDFALIVSVGWLLVQNSLLVMWLSSQHLGPWLTVARALFKVGLHFAAHLWILPAAAVLGVALALSTGERQDARREGRGISHA
jgi:hypothetical protein